MKKIIPPRRTPRIGFAQRELNESKLLPAERFIEPLEVRCFVVETESGPACWLAFDLTGLYVAECAAIRSAVATLLGGTPASVVVHCTHTHSVPSHFGAFPVEVLMAQAVSAAREAQAQLQPFRMVETCVDVGNRFSVMRRKCLPGIGAFTVWYGYRLENGRAEGAALIREHAARIFGARHTQIPELAQPIWFDDPVDPLLQAIVFVGRDGDVIGSLLRFSSHPHTTSHVDSLRYHPDFPGFARSAMERGIGGRCIYLTGPCGDIVPKEDMMFRMPERPDEAKQNLGPSYWHKDAADGDGLRTARHQGEALAQAVLDRLVRPSKGRSPAWPAEPAAPGIVRARTVGLRVPLRKDYSPTPAQARIARDAAFARFLELREREGASLWELRALADRVQQRDAEATDLRGLPAGTLDASAATLDLGLLQLGNLILAGLPSEPLVGTSHRLRANTFGPRLWTVGLVNGWIGYMPGSLDCTLGGYEAGRTSLAPDGLDRYEAQACNAILALAQ